VNDVAIHRIGMHVSADLGGQRLEIDHEIAAREDIANVLMFNEQRNYGD